MAFPFLDSLRAGTRQQKIFMLVVLAISLLMLALALAGDPVRLAWRYDRVAVEGGQWWRLFTCELVHLNVNHALVNVAGFFLCCLIFNDLLSLRRLALWFFPSALVVGLAFYYVDTELQHYVGLSGILYGLMFMSVILGVPGQPGLHLFLLALLTARIGYEHLPGYNPDYGLDWLGGSVYTNSHLYGSAMGILTGLLLVGWSIRQGSGNGNSVGNSAGGV